MRRAAEVIERNSQSLTQIVSDILDLSAVTAGKTRLDIEQTNLVSILDDALLVVQPAADAKGLTLVRDVPADAVILAADSRRLQQVFWNLLSNAVKFTRPGDTVTVHLHDSPQEVVVTVTDTGVGIDAAFLPFVFHRFSQADMRTTRELGGMGIGLALVRHFIELHGGTVAVHSDGVDRGAKFTVVLPRAPKQTSLS